MTAPRLISGTEAASYCGVMPATFSKWVATGVMPKPIEFTRRWDRKAIDLALDKASGIAAPSIVPQEDEFSKWKAEHEARKGTARTGNRK
jgi:predicted DNA-binding transcriptional regulator AlpA